MAIASSGILAAGLLVAGSVAVPPPAQDPYDPPTGFGADCISNTIHVRLTFGDWSADPNSDLAGSLGGKTVTFKLTRPEGNAVWPAAAVMAGTVTSSGQEYTLAQLMADVRYDESDQSWFVPAIKAVRAVGPNSEVVIIDGLFQATNNGQLPGIALNTPSYGPAHSFLWTSHVDWGTVTFEVMFNRDPNCPIGGDDNPPPDPNDTDDPDDDGPGGGEPPGDDPDEDDDPPEQPNPLPELGMQCLDDFMTAIEGSLSEVGFTAFLEELRPAGESAGTMEFNFPGIGGGSAMEFELSTMPDKTTAVGAALDEVRLWIRQLLKLMIGVFAVFKTVRLLSVA